MPLPDALAKLTRERAQLAAVVDEFGGFAGVLTLEDMAEEVVGELTDEHDQQFDNVITPEDDTSWRMDGDVHIDEVERALGHHLPQGDFETIAGLAIAAHHELPEEGRTVTVELPVEPREMSTDDPRRYALHITVQRVEHHVPAEALVQLVEVDNHRDDSPGRDNDNDDDDDDHVNAGGGE